MATLADIVVEESGNSSLAGNSDAARKALSEAITESAESGTAAKQSAADGPNSDPLAVTLSGDAVPEKFRGKSLKDVIDSYGNLESRLGSMANELGTQRQLTDRLLDLKRNDDLRKNTPTTRVKPQVTASEILDKPAETLDRVLTERESVITDEVNRRLAAMQMSIAESTFKGRHPDFNEVANSTSFGEWVRSSPIRLRAAAAANGGDWQIADELLSEFKNSRRAAAGGSSRQDSTSSGANLEEARRVTLESSTGAGGSDGVKKGKTYRRADLMRLRIDDPETYYDDGFQAEILRAYHEKRVVD